MPTSNGFVHGTPNDIKSTGEQLDPSHIAKAKAAAQALNGNHQCGMPLPGCTAFIAAEQEAFGKLSVFYDAVERGLTEFTAAASESATNYTNHDATGRAALQQALDQVPPQLTD
jgi:hypothetical protein